MLGAFKLNTLSAALGVASAPNIKATGGAESLVTISGTSYKLHTFTQAGAFPTFSVDVGGTVDMLLVGGGGSGGTTNAISYNQRCGGGGGGQVRIATGITATPQIYAITVASGGSPGGKNNGSASVALGESAAGGGAGGAGSTVAADMNGASVTGGSGGGATYNSYFGASGNPGTGTYNGASGVSAAGGGGGGAGASATSRSGGNGIQVNFTGTATYYGGGGGGGGSGASGGLGGGGNGGNLVAGSAGAANTGGGGGGASDDSGINRSGGAGGTGLVIIRYPFTPGPAVTSVSTVTSKTGISSSSGNFVMPTGGDLAPNYYNVDVGDVAILFDSSTSTTDVTPTGWTSITKTSTSGIRQNISYKILTASDLGATITGMAGVNRKVMLIYRGNSAFNTINVTVTGSQSTTAVPTNQSLVGQAGPMIAFAAYSSTGAITTSGWSVGSPTQYNASSTSVITVKALITNSGTPSTTTISMSDGGTNSLQTFRMAFG